MTEISLYTNDSGDRLTGFECKDHSGFARRGKDIVCAAVSVLTVNCVNSIESLIGIEPEVNADEKRGYLEVKITDYDREDVQLLLRSLELGLKEIAKEYERNVNLTNRRCTP